MLNNKTAVITGGTRGIGIAVSKQLAEDGYAVCALYVSPRAREEILEISEALSLPGQPVMVERCDISKKTDREKTLNKILEAWGRVDVLVNNAGTAPKERLDLLETTEESFDYVMDINLKGAFFFTQMTARAMIKQIKQNPGMDPKIINISSVSAYASSVNRGEYCLSKAGVSMMTALFADRLAEYGIRVYEIRPGIIATDMTSGSREKYDRLISEGLTPIRRWGKPQDVAEGVSVICGGKLNFSTGEIINIDGGFHLRRL